MADLDDIRWELPPETDPGVGLAEDPLDGGPLHEQLLRPVDRRVWTLTASQMTTTEASALETVFVACRGPVGTTLVTPPGGGSQVTVEFVDDALELRRVAGDTWQAQVRVREVP